jgi:hypothetical protein
LEDSRKAEAELLEFATKVVQGLIAREELLSEGQIPSDLRLFCRVDVGVMRVSSQGEDDARYQYFVNEVERGHATCLFGILDESSGEVISLAHSFVRHLPAFLELYNSPVRV